MPKNPTTGNGTGVGVPCTINTCPLSDGIITYQPNIPGNATFLGLFGLLFLVQLYIGIRHKTWSYLAAMLLGLAAECVGYVGRIQLHHNPFNFNFFLEYLICLTIAPAFLTAGIYLTLARIVSHGDQRLSWVRPKTLSVIFMTSDFICLVLQATGGAITSTSNGESKADSQMRRTGVNIMIGGLSFQVVSLFCFMLYAAMYAWRWYAATVRFPAHRSLSPRMGSRWTWLIIGLTVASLTIFVRCCFRVAELQNGFSGALANNEVAFMILEGTMISIAGLCLTFCHPGLCPDLAWKIVKPMAQKVQDAESNVDLQESLIEG